MERIIRMQFPKNSLEFLGRIEKIIESCKCQGRYNCNFDIDSIDCFLDTRSSVITHISNEEERNRRGYVHGGITAWIFDQCMGMTCHAYTNLNLVTQTMTVNYMHPIECNDKMTITSKVVSYSNRIVNMYSEIEMNGIVCATATSLYHVIREK